jgi:hypothetical protein
VRVENGKLDRQRLRKTAFLRGVVRAASEPYLVWAMPEARCAERDDHCVNRPTGLTRFDKGSTVLGEPTWKLPGHPAGRLDRSLVISSTGRVDLLSKADAHGGLELVRVRLPNTVSAAGAEAGAPGSDATPGTTEPVRLEASETWAIATPTMSTARRDDASSAPQARASAAPSTAANAVPGADAVASIHSESSATLVAGEPLAVLRASDAADGVAASLTWLINPVQSTTLAPAAGSGAWALACSARETRWLAYGSSRELRISAARLASGAQALTAQPVDLAAVLDENDGSRDRVRLACSEQGARLFYIDRAQVLSQITCAADSCEPAREVARDIAQFSVAQRGASSLLAYQAGPSAPTIKLLRLDEHGAALAPPAIVASCWEPLGGMCGIPTLVSANERIVLLARDGPDLLALETGNEGHSFTSLSGFSATNRSFDPGTTSPLEQHRKRKGIE